MTKLCLFLILCSSFIAIADDSYQEVSYREESTLNPITANFNLSYNSLSNTNTQSLTGPGIELQLTYALHERWGMGFAIKQMNLGDSGSASALNFRVTYALLGKLLNKDTKAYFKKDLMVEKKNIERPCLCIQVMASQHYLNATQTTVPFTGYGVSGYYKYPTKTISSLIAGASYESISNVNTVTVISLFAGLEFRI